jgi:hypothetical protein
MIVPMAVPVGARETRAEPREPSATSAAIPSTNPSSTNVDVVRSGDTEQSRRVNVA